MHAFMYTIDADGNVAGSASVTAQPHSVAARDGVVGTSGWKVTLHCGFGWCSRTYDLVWTAGASSGSMNVWTTSAFGSSMQTPLVSPSSIAAAKERFAVAWTTQTGVTYFLTGDGNNLVAAWPDLSVRPGLACDEAQCVIGYGQAGDVHAFAFPIDRLTGPELLTIAATERVERMPQVHALGPGRFLILYRSDGSDGARMNWRVVTFGASRRRVLN